MSILIKIAVININGIKKIMSIKDREISKYLLRNLYKNLFFTMHISVFLSFSNFNISKKQINNI